MAGRRTKNPTFFSDDTLLNNITLFQVFALLVIAGIVYFYFWSRKHLRFSADCPKCLATEFVKRKHRSYFAKKIIPFLRINKLNCSRCNVTFYQAFSEK